MGTSKTKEVSAQVVMKPASGSRSDEPVTAENVHRMMPSDEDLRKAASFFQQHGFRVENAFGNSFSITGPASLVEKVFNTKLSESEKGGLESARRGGSKSLELSVEELPKDVAGLIEAVTFSEPPDFGPGNP